MKKLSTLIRHGITGKKLQRTYVEMESKEIIGCCTLGAAFIGLAKELGSEYIDSSVRRGTLDSYLRVDKQTESFLDEMYIKPPKECTEKECLVAVGFEPNDCSLFQLIIHLNDDHDDLSREWIANYLESQGY